MSMARFPTSVRLSDEQSDALTKIGERDDRSKSWLISKAIDEFIERNLEPKPKPKRQNKTHN